jgi:hypothetical protein
MSCFQVNGQKCYFNIKSLRILDKPEVVSVYGWGNGQYETPDLLLGFASTKGLCNAPTRVGDCSAPVLDKDGRIVGFWTHGNGVVGHEFGKFEVVTQEMIDFHKSTPVLNSLLFQ